MAVELLEGEKQPGGPAPPITFSRVGAPEYRARVTWPVWRSLTALCLSHHRDNHGGSDHYSKKLYHRKL